jgi:hypothetical protein
MGLRQSRENNPFQCAAVATIEGVSLELEEGFCETKIIPAPPHANSHYQETSPFLKWAGGKRWLVEKHSHLLNIEHERYIEPFVGSGAVFLACFRIPLFFAIKTKSS